MNNKVINLQKIDLDGAGIIYPYAANKSWNSVYRIEACLKRPVNPDALVKAVEGLRRDYPYFFMTLAKTKTKFFLCESERPVNIVYNGDTELCKPFDLESGEPLIRFLYTEKKIILEMFHTLTDGHGATALVTALLSKYKNALTENFEDASKEDEKSVSLLESKTDVFQTLYSEGGKNVSRLMTGAFQIRRDTETEPGFKTLEIPCDKLLRAAHALDVSVAVLVCALQIKAIAMSQGDIKKAIRISVPVDLRKIFGLTSCRNSSLYFLVSAKADETNDFFSLLENVKKQFKANLTEENMRNLAFTNASSENLKAFKILPVAVKKAILKFGYSHLGENQFTATMTDIGVVALDERLRDLVESVYFVLGRQKINPVNIAVTTFGGTARLVVSYDTDCSEFFKALSGLVHQYIS